ncbi:MAG: site-specific tyrosine recombinase XerC [Betaproteobacteria bacterium ADurb.Bin341]|nr:MAG: site-specific tyrosine recombinase XerC [Betaproteobacteria bacterium ADurb.Bin341]
MSIITVGIDLAKNVFAIHGVDERGKAVLVKPKVARTQLLELIANLLYGSGLRIMEALRLRVKDVDFAGHQILVRDGKGFKDRVTMLPAALRTPLKDHLLKVKALHDSDLAAGNGAVYLPYALARKYPNAEREWAWQYVFPSIHLS